jgi:hypothetical protein
VIMEMLLQRDCSRVVQERSSIVITALIEQSSSGVLCPKGPKNSAIETAWRLTSSEILRALFRQADELAYQGRLPSPQTSAMMNLTIALLQLRTQLGTKFC